MSVENVNVIDVVSIDQKGNVVLTISDDLEWDEGNVHLLKLQTKLNAYLDAIDNGSLYDSYKDVRDRKIIINVVAKYFPNKDGETFIKRTREVLESVGYGFTFTNLIK